MNHIKRIVALVAITLLLCGAVAQAQDHLMKGKPPAPIARVLHRVFGNSAVLDCRLAAAPRGAYACVVDIRNGLEVTAYAVVVNAHGVLFAMIESFGPQLQPVL